MPASSTKNSAWRQEPTSSLATGPPLIAPVSPGRPIPTPSPPQAMVRITSPAANAIRAFMPNTPLPRDEHGDQGADETAGEVDAIVAKAGDPTGDPGRRTTWMHAALRRGLTAFAPAALLHGRAEQGVADRSCHAAGESGERHPGPPEQRGRESDKGRSGDLGRRAHRRDSARRAGIEPLSGNYRAGSAGG